MRRIPKRHLAPGQSYVPPTKMLDPRIVIAPDKEFDSRFDDLLLLNYGWGFTDKFAFAYAKRHSLELELYQESYIELAGREIIKCAELADDPLEKQQDELWEEMCILVRKAVLLHIEKAIGFTLDLGDPFCDEYPSMIVLYTNYNVMKRTWIIERVTGERMATHIQKLSRIMAEPGEETKEIMWWYARENPIVRSVSLPYLTKSDHHGLQCLALKLD